MINADELKKQNEECLAFIENNDMSIADFIMNFQPFGALLLNSLINTGVVVCIDNKLYLSKPRATK